MMQHSGFRRGHRAVLLLASGALLLAGSAWGESAQKPVAATNPAVAKAAPSSITFRVRSANTGSLNRVRIEPQGLKGKNLAVEKEIDGTVVDAEVADLNIDGSPEVYVYVTSAGSGSYGSLVAYAVNKRKSMTEIYLPSLADDPKAAKGYRGHDEFRVVENTLVRRFPVYRDGDTNAQPTGGIRQVQYKLKAGEAGWVLRPDQIVNY
jgi:hypothetical protein